MNNLEPANIAITVFSIFVAPQVAEILGAYSVIILAAIVGAGWALGRVGGNFNLKDAILFFIKINLTALVITVPLAYFVAHKYDFTEPQWLIAPVAFLIGFVGNDWVRLNSALFTKIKAVIDLFLSKEK